LIKVAIFGGSFDPPHIGHQTIVNEALRLLEIDKLIVVPAFLNPFKQHSLASPKMRLEWCRSIFSHNSKILVSDYEISLNKTVYTEETIRYFKKYYFIKYLIIGADNISKVDTWRGFHWLNNNVIWVIATRDNHYIDTSKIKKFIILNIGVEVSSTKIKSCNNLEHIDRKILAQVNTIINKHKEHNEHR